MCVYSFIYTEDMYLNYQNIKSMYLTYLKHQEHEFKISKQVQYIWRTFVLRSFQTLENDDVGQKTSLPALKPRSTLADDPGVDKNVLGHQ